MFYIQLFERELISRVAVHQKEYVIKNFETGYCFTESVICSQEMSFKNMLKLILDKHFFIKKNINPDVVIKDFVSMQCNILVFLKIFSKIVSRKLYVIDYSLRCYLKSDSHLPKKNCFICFKESSLKVMINALFVLNFHLEFLAI